MRLDTLWGDIKPWVLPVLATVVLLFALGAICYAVLYMDKRPSSFSVEQAPKPIGECLENFPEKPFDYNNVASQYNRCYYAAWRYVSAAKAMHDAGSLDHRERAMEWSLLTSRLMFAVVIVITLSGVAMAWLAIARGEKGETEFKISREGLEIKSPIVGLIILALSLAFLYLYVSRVFPVSEVTSEPATPQSSASG